MNTELWLENGSRVVALPGHPGTTRGYTPALVILDEASRADEGLLAAMLPSISESDGDLMLLSTPAGRRGFFYECWTDDTQPWERVSACRADYPHRLRPGFLEEQRRILGPALFRQEHCNEFVEDGDQVLGDDAIQAIKRWNRPGISVLTALEGL